MQPEVAAAEQEQTANPYAAEEQTHYDQAAANPYMQPEEQKQELFGGADDEEEYKP